MTTSFTQYLLTERFVNLFTKDQDQRKENVDVVWDILQQSYKKLGGLKGSGFNSKEDMIAKIPFWKLMRKGGKIVSVVMYKDKEGRKLVAGGTNGTPEGKEGLMTIIIDDLTRQRAYAELSDRLLHSLKKIVGSDVLKKYLIKPEKLAKLSGDEIQKPKPDDPELERHPELADYFYTREIGGHIHTKLALGVSGNKLIEY